jgi:hypothetical protein
MRADHDHRRKASPKLRTIFLIAALATAAALPTASSARPDPAQVATGRCVPISRGAPCLGTIQSEYAYAGLGGGAVTYIHAHPGAEERIGTAADENPITQRTFTWHSVASVKIVAAFIVTEIGLTGRYSYQRVPTGEHGGHAVLVAKGDISVPRLLLEGSRTAPPPPVTSKHCVSFVTEAPCLGPIQTLFGFSGKAGGAVHDITTIPGPEEEIGKNPEGIPIMRRSFTWRSVASVKLVAAFVLTPVSKDGKAVRIRGQFRWSVSRVPTDAHSGEATLTSSEGSSLAPFLLLEGSR